MAPNAWARAGLRWRDRMSDRRRVLHIVTGLDIGGAELYLYRLATSLRERYDQVVVNLSNSSELEERFRSEGITVHHSALKQRPLTGFRRLARLIDEFQPGLIHSWMYHANIVASLVRRRTGRGVPLIWSVRHSVQSFAAEKWSLRQIIRLGGFGIWHPDVVTYNAFRGRDSHLQFGYGRYASEVIVNGVDLRRFARKVAQRQSFREQLDCTENTLLVGYVGRFHVLKDLPTLIACFAAIHQRLPDARFVMVGRGLVTDNRALNGLIDAANLSGLVRCIGTREDVAEVYSGLDLLVLSSLAEGTANVLLEAMACEVPCVTTDVGDCARLVAEERFVSPRRDSENLAERAIAVLKLDPHTREELGVLLRRRMVNHYDQVAAEAAYIRLYDGLLEREVGG